MRSVRSQPTLLLHTVSYTPSFPARCYELSRNCPNADKSCRAIGESCVHMCNRPHKQASTHAATHHWEMHFNPPNKHKTVATCKGHNLASSLFSTKCLPCLLWQPTQWLCTQPTAFCTQLISHMHHEVATEYLDSGIFENIFTNKIRFDSRNRQSRKFMTGISLITLNITVD